MNGNKLLLDTNILLYLLGGDKTLAVLLEGKSTYTSFITELELFGFGTLKAKEKLGIKKALEQCTIIDINAGIKQLTIETRQTFGLALPDCIIAATAIYLDIPLITADQGFKKIKSLDIILYEK
ncbi:MAG: type II toxin-antitoxin system VapC family toxin [Flavobacteriales bacterium]|nr:type II toxin-antitoxin system VapC family toxin [Flavobacteriales bacterium]MCB9447334.1 type II toxin-antitoxin system VapC family toxin [Flavobacteriales bacterium]